jgi:hypothetical protein
VKMFTHLQGRLVHIQRMLEPFMRQRLVLKLVFISSKVSISGPFSAAAAGI